MTQISFTHFKGEKNTVAKAYDIIEKKLTKIPADTFYFGTFDTIKIQPEKLIKYIKSIKPGEFITAGVHQTLNSGMCPQDARRKVDVFKFASGISLLIIDCDALPDLGITSEEQCISAIRSLDPALKNVQFVSSPSASSGIVYNNDDSGLRGLHAFGIVDDGSHIPQVLEQLYKRSVIAGYARAKVAKSGVIYIRSLIDLAMKSPNQPCYEGGARILNKAIKQHRTIKSYGKGIIKVADLRPLTDAEDAVYLERCTELKKSVYAESLEKRSNWCKEQELKLINKGATPDKAKHLVNQMLEGSELADGIEICTDHFGTVTVAEILADPEKFHEQTCADPFDSENGQNKAKIYTLQDIPCIHSFAHGGAVYKLKEPAYSRQELQTMINSTDNVDELIGPIAKLIAISGLRETEREILQRAIKNKTGVSIASIRSDAKAFQNTNLNNEISHIRQLKM